MCCCWSCSSRSTHRSCRHREEVHRRKEEARGQVLNLFVVGSVLYMAASNQRLHSPPVNTSYRGKLLCPPSPAGLDIMSLTQSNEIIAPPSACSSLSGDDDRSVCSADGKP